MGNNKGEHAVIRWLAQRVRHLDSRMKELERSALASDHQRESELEKMGEEEQDSRFQFSADAEEFVPRFAPGYWGSFRDDVFGGHRYLITSTGATRTASSTRMALPTLATRTARLPRATLTA